MRVVEGRVDVDDLDEFLDRLDRVGAGHDCAIQAFDADYVLGRDHLRAAVERADRAFEREENVARDRAVEILLYAAGRRQIDRALRMGVPEDESDVVVVVHAPATDPDGSEADHGPAPDDDPHHRERAAADAVDARLAPAETLSADRIDCEAVREFFGVTDAELAATDAELGDLVRERVALLDVEK